ncbi:MAG: CocE/NonD family hydrolase [Acidobacteriota bacterium]
MSANRVGRRFAVRVSRVGRLGFVFWALSCFGCGDAGDESLAGVANTQPPSKRFVQQQAMIEMRDGIRLNTEIYVPRDGSGPWPILVTRTPYGLGHDDDGFHRYLSRHYRELVDDGYIFVFQDIRGRYASEGEFAMQRAPAAVTGRSIDEATDTQDTIDWVLENVPEHNGKVGMLGVSYGGWLTVMSMLDPHPALAAVSPQASPADMFLGDDFAHNGAFRLAPSFGYVALMETGKLNAPFQFDQHDAYEWYLDLGPYSNVNDRHFKEPRPTWEAFMANPNYSDYWKRASVLSYLEQIGLPALHVAGWWDAEDLFGPLAIYDGLEEWDEQNLSSLVVGPWRHGGWSSGDGRTLGAIDFGSPTAVTYRAQIQRAFFAHHLKDQPNSGAWPAGEATIFQTGTNAWRSFDDFPPASKQTRLYLGADRSLSLGEPLEAGSRQYVSDPESPVPYMPRPMPGFWQGGQALWKVTDQRFVDRRPDVLSWQSEPMSKPLEICGAIDVHLVASTSGTDSDWIVKLIDVYPEDYEANSELRGFQLMVADEVFRARFRDSFETPSAVPANRPVAYDFSLGSRCHTFLPGHSVMVQVQSTWFPLIGRNPQTFVDIPSASASDYRSAMQKIFAGGEGSYLSLPVVDLSDAARLFEESGP